MSPVPPLSDDDDALAAELAMGLLDGEDRRMAEARTASDPAFRAAVAAWQERLAPLAETLPDAAPPSGALAGIERRLGWTAPTRRRRLVPGRFGWPAALAGAAVAALLAIWVAVTLVPFGEQPVLVATLTAEDSELRFEARHDPRDQRLTIERVAGAAPARGRVHEVWIIAPGAAPVSLGLIGETSLSLDYPAPPAGWTLAVSLEPEGGSVTGAPTGPVLAAGPITNL
ncbi:MAG: anti-sigma factor domain-containing protein [Gemmobacter sp.]